MVPIQRTYVTAIIWLAMLLASSLPYVVWHEGLQMPSSRFGVVWFQLSGLLLLGAMALAFKPLRIACIYILLVFALVIGWHALPPLVLDNTHFIQDTIQNYGIGWSLFLSRFALLPPAILMTLVVVGRYSWRELFLAWGDFSAPVQWSILFPLPVRTWSMMLALGCLLTIVLLGSVLLYTIGLDANRLGRLPAHLPAVLITSAFNAAGEEYIFRMLPLAVLIPIVGRSQAIAVTAVDFGLGHWYGTPPGPLGVLLMAYGGWALGKSMVETGGFGWAWCLHAFGDVMVFSLLVLAHLDAASMIDSVVR